MSPVPFLLRTTNLCQSMGGTLLWLGLLHIHLHVFLSCSPQGMGFTLEERLQLGIHGLIPPCFLSQDVQALRIMKYYERQRNDLDKSVPESVLYPSLG